MAMKRIPATGVAQPMAMAAIGCWGGCWYGGCWGGCWPGVAADAVVVQNVAKAMGEMPGVPPEMKNLFESAARASVAVQKKK